MGALVPGEAPYGRDSHHGARKGSKNDMAQSQRLFSPVISKHAAEKKRKGKIEDELYKDGLERQAKKKQAAKESVRHELESAGPVPSSAKKTEDLLMTRFYKDLEDVYQQFEIDDKAEISEVTMTEVMLLMGFVR